MASINELLREMIAVNAGDPARAQHLIKVHALARLIGTAEGLPESERFTLETAAAVHDIAIPYCEKRFGRCDGKMQEREGPALADELLTRLGFARPVIERACYLVGHHHTYEGVCGSDYQILLEADFLVNLFEDASAKDAVRSTYERIFKTESGRALCRTMFGL